MLKFKETHIQLGKVANVALMPYKFEGTNMNAFDVKMNVVASCGCTTVENQSRIIKAGQPFEINGNLTRRANAVKTTKTLTVTVISNNKSIQVERLLFTMDLIHINDI